MSFWKRLFGAEESPKASIYSAVEDGNLNRVDTLIEEHPRIVFTKNNEGETPLHFAAGNNNVGDGVLTDVAASLIAKGADINQR